MVKVITVKGQVSRRQKFDQYTEDEKKLLNNDKQMLANNRLTFSSHAIKRAADRHLFRIINHINQYVKDSQIVATEVYYAKDWTVQDTRFLLRCDYGSHYVYIAVSSARRQVITLWQARK